MKKYYYTDPLKAAWMAREFGFKFLLGVKDTRDNVDYWTAMPIDDSILEWPKLELDIEKFNIRYFIHPDSYHLLELQEGDLLKHRDSFTGYFDADISRLGYVRSYMGTSAMHDSMERFEIIQRNNKTFFMPEVEK